MGNSAAFHSADRNVRYSDYIIYADESGDPNPASVDANYPVFVLNFCVFRKDYYAGSVLPAVAAFKFEHFGHDAVVLHEQDIHRGKHPFDFGGNGQAQATFRHELNAVITGLDFGIIATVIDKSQLGQPPTVADVYGLALRRCMEQVYGFLETCGQHNATTHVVLESRGRKEDTSLARVPQYIGNGDNVISKVQAGFDLVFAAKKSNSIGLQIADLTAYSIGRSYITPDKPNRIWETLVKPKLLNTVEVFHVTEQEKVSE